MRAAAFAHPNRRPQHRLLSPLPALIPRMVALAALAVAFVALTIAVTAGVFASLDQQVAQAMHSIWQEPLHVLFQAIAELGGLELTTILTIALALYLLRGGFRSDALVAVAFVAAEGLELLYKYNLHHPGPPFTLSHADGPSLTSLLGHAGPGNSFPSGHMMRAVIVYGLLAFVVRRLVRSPHARALAIPVAIVVIVLVAFDRIYLDVHWESDVIGGLVLGAIALLAGTVWLDRPITADN
jgi:membrane-associated phospholipid phosphatase